MSRLENMLAYAVMKQALAPYGWRIEEVGNYAGFVLTPPAAKDYPCPTCQGALLEIVVNAASPDGHGHVMPCSCRMMPDEMPKVLQAGK